MRGRLVLVFWCTCFVDVVSYKPTVMANLHDTVVLPCSYDYDFLQEYPRQVIVRWEFKDSLFIHNSTYEEMRSGKKKDHRIHFIGQFLYGILNIEIRNVTKDDEGAYMCMASTPKKYQSKIIKLQIKKTETDGAVYLGPLRVRLYENLRLQCGFHLTDEGDRCLNVIWEHKRRQFLNYIDGKTELSDAFTGRVLLEGKLTITLENVTEEDEGKYFCRLSTCLGYKYYYYDVKVTDMNAAEIYGGLTTVQGERRLMCTCRGFFLNPTVWWYDESGQIIPRQKSSVTIEDLDDDRRLLTSTLNTKVHLNKHYFCAVHERKFKRLGRVVLSDGSAVMPNPVALQDTVYKIKGA
ncbi:ORF101 [Ranid herpesvirus 2]|uniref:ORF101 n=1 Tax=Ranid herpesvirus 2 TaxID=389214 RepID=Q14W05_9VIRU|nr:ORF101 [Ranid herpesvirus 2]ABG25627.1 ORF101 [Ranid herpesvirus 2]